MRDATTGGFTLTAKYPGGGANIAFAPDTTSALNGDLLRFEGSLWKTDAGGVHKRIPLPFKGAPLQRSTDLANVSFPVLVSFQSAVYDTRSFWDVANPTRITVPMGVTKVRRQASVSLKPGASTGGVYVSFEKNGSGGMIGGGVFTVRRGTSGCTNNDFAAGTAVLPVTADDYFEFRVNATSSSWDDIQAATVDADFDVQRHTGSSSGTAAIRFGAAGYDADVHRDDRCRDERRRVWMRVWWMWLLLLLRV